MRRITLEISNTLHEEISQIAKQTGRKFGQVAADYCAKNLLAEYVAHIAKDALSDVAASVTDFTKKTETRLMQIEQMFLQNNSHESAEK